MNRYSVKPSEMASSGTATCGRHPHPRSGGVSVLASRGDATGKTTILPHLSEQLTASLTIAGSVFPSYLRATT
jgi:hypothetical protein